MIRKSEDKISFGVNVECPKFTLFELKSGTLYFVLLSNVLYPDNVN